MQKKSSPSALPETLAPAPASLAPAQTPQFFIPATASLQERRPRTLKHGDTFAVFDHNGDAIAGPGSADGVFHRDTRHLSHFYLTMDGVRPMLLSSTLRDDNDTLTCDLANPDLLNPEGELALEHDVLHLRRLRFLRNSTCFERLVIRNFGEDLRRVRIEIAFDADFADLFEVRGARRARRGERHAPECDGESLTLSYTGLDERRRTTTLRFEPAPTELTSKTAVFVFDLARRETHALFIEIHFSSEGPYEPPRQSFFRSLRESRRSLRASLARTASVVTSNDIFNETIRRSVSDLYMLVTETPQGPYPYAGIPWFSTVFGRDGLITALEMLWLDPSIARGVLMYLAANQATARDDAADAEPGKILHEVRQGEMAELGEVPFRHYYGSIDSTPLFVFLAGAYLERTDDVETLRQLWPHIEAALSWIDNYGDRDGDGFVEYGRQNPQGLINQGWKDSHDSVSHADGALAKGPIALVEVQAYVYGAWRAAAQISRRLADAVAAARFEKKADDLRKAFDARFFDEELGAYVLALDGDKRPCRIKTSNSGHALFAGVAYPERAETIVRTLMERSSFSGWGVRTLSATAARYNPMSYHNGSVWPHDNALIGAGFARYGYRREAARVFEGLFAAATYVDLRRLPELFCGFPRQRTQGPVFYPTACAPQAWSAAAPVFLLQACLGLGFDPQALQITFDEPALPSFLDEVVLRRLSVGEGSADVALRRSGPHVVVDVLRRHGGARVLTRN